MRIDQLSIGNFRIYKGHYKFDFKNKDLIIVHGQNGNGKSCLFDAIEWCITGELDRYRGSAEQQKFNYLMHKDEYKKNGVMYVEIIFDNQMKICRLLKLGSSGEIKEIIINDKKSKNLTEGNKQIKKMICNSHEHEIISDNNLFKRYFTSTQILSQDKLTSFVNFTKPQDRFNEMENILGLNRYGKDFSDYITNIIKLEEKANLDISENMGNMKTTVQKIKNDIDYLESLIEMKKTTYIKEGIKDKDSLLDYFKSKKHKYEVCPVIIKEMEDSVNISLSTAIKGIESESMKSSKIVETMVSLKFKSQSEITDINMLIKNLKDEEEYINIDIKGLNNSIEGLKIKRNSIYKAIQNETAQVRGLNKQLEKLGIYKDLNIQYNKRILRANQLDINIKEINKKFNVVESTILSKLSDFKSIVEFKNQYNKYKNELDHIEKIIQYEDNIKIIKEINDKIKTNNTHIQDNNNKISNIKKQIDKISKDIIDLNINDKLTIEESEVSLIIQVQNIILQQENQNNCLVCGTVFEKHEELKNSIKLQSKNTSNTINNNSNLKITLHSNLKELEFKKSNYIKDIEKLKIKIIEYEKEQNELKSRNTLIESKVSDKDFEERNELFSKKTSIKNFIDANENFYMSTDLLNNLENDKIELLNQLDTNKRLIDEILKNIDEEDLLKDSNKISEKINTNSIELTKLNNSIKSETQNKANVKKEILSINSVINDYNKSIGRIDKLINGFPVNFDKILEKINSLTYSIKSIEALISDIEELIEAYTLYSNNKDYNQYILSMEKTRKSLHEEDLKLKSISDNKKISDIKLLYLNELKSEGSVTHSELMNDFMIRYNTIIDELYSQITPHNYNNHVNLVVKDSELFILLDEEKYNTDQFDDYNISELKSFANASLTLSSAQSGILAVCIFVAMNMSQNWSKLNFIGVDDPFQNMDDINVFSFLDVISNVLINKQAMISSHNEKFSKLLHIKSRVESDRICDIYLKSYDRNMVKVKSDCLEFTEI